MNRKVVLHLCRLKSANKLVPYFRNVSGCHGAFRLILGNLRGLVISQDRLQHIFGVLLLDPL